MPGDSASNGRAIPVNAKTIAAGLSAIGAIAMAAAGLVIITTPGEQECNAKLTEVRVEKAKALGAASTELADARARLELLTEAKEACQDVLDDLTRRSP